MCKFSTILHKPFPLQLQLKSSMERPLLLHQLQVQVWAGTIQIQNNRNFRHMPWCLMIMNNLNTNKMFQPYTLSKVCVLGYFIHKYSVKKYLMHFIDNKIWVTVSLNIITKCFTKVKIQWDIFCHKNTRKDRYSRLVIRCIAMEK